MRCVSPDTCVVGVAPRADELALVICVCVQLLLKRGATTPTFQTPVNMKRGI